MLDIGLSQILRLQIPRIAHGRVHVTDMHLIRTCYDTFGDGVIARNDDVVAGHVKLLDGERHQPEIVAEMTTCQRQALDEGGIDSLAGEEVTRRLGDEIHQGEQVGFGEAGDKLLQHPLRAGIGLQPFVNQRDPHTAHSCPPQQR